MIILLNIIINHLLENKLIYNNYKSQLGTDIIDNINEDTTDVRVMLLYYYGKQHKCYNNIVEIIH